METIEMRDSVDQLLERVRQALRTDDRQVLLETLPDVHPADLAEIYLLLNDDERSSLIYALPPHAVAELVILLDEAERGEVVEEMDGRALTEFVQQLEPDDAADVVAQLTDEQRDSLLQQMEGEQARQLAQLLAYPEDSAGGIMTPVFVALSAEATVADAVAQIRGASHKEEIHEVYVVDDRGRLVGVVPLRDLVTSESDATLGSICLRDPICVHVVTDQEEVAQTFGKYELAEVAVVDAEHRLVGRITSDDLIEVLHEEAAEDLYRMAGTDAAELESSSVAHAAFVRLTWLLPCLLGTCLTAGVIVTFEHHGVSPIGAAQIAMLLAFVPMIGAMGGNSGIQTSTIIVRGFATNDVAVRTLRRAFARESRVAILVAVACGITAGSLGLLFITIIKHLTGEDPADAVHFVRIGVAVGLGMFSAIMSATALGTFLPFLFRSLGVDPAIASGPIITTTNDFVTVTIYLSIAFLILT